jgi:hypothetical protein
MSLSNNEKTQTTWLILGDGDFSFSFDLARYLAQNSTTRQNLIATGFDSYYNLVSKYIDAPFLLRELSKLDCASLNVKIRHDVNAVRAPNELSMLQALQANRVIFNHPHLGTEDMRAHSYFLNHLFHAVSSYWLLPGGVLYVTLARGQFDRWDCQVAAQKHGFTLLRRGDFVPPPVENPRYEFRRHQAAKSFKQATMGQSETFVYARTEEASSDAHAAALRLDWYDEAVNVSKLEEDIQFECSHCSRAFLNERAYKQHVQAKHPDGNKRKRDDVFVCLECVGETRSFESNDALEDHIRAKHTAIHTGDAILPDWSSVALSSDKATSFVFGECPICGCQFDSKKQAEQHLLLFEPQSQTTLNKEVIGTSYNCSFCSKSFRERRAQRQHENTSCPKRPELQSRVTDN